MKEMLKLGLVLALFAGISCVALAFVNDLTAPAIAEAAQKELEAGLSIVFDGADSFEEVAGAVPALEGTVTLDGLYAAKKGGKTAGVVVKVTGPTYDKATILVGVDADKKITGVHILSISDTAGFGQKATEPKFYGQFAGKSATLAFTPKEDFDAISGATITTNGFAGLLRQATATACSYLDAN